MIFNWKNIYFLSSIGFLVLVVFLFEPIVFGGKMFGSPDSLSPRSVGIALNKASEELGNYPHWQPWVFSGMPTAEAFSYLSKLYFPEYIFKLFSLSGAFIQLLHLVFAGLGCMFLLKQFKCSSLASFMGSIAFMTTPYMITMAVYGHGSQLMTAAYIPWVVWLSVRLWSSPNLVNCGFLALLLGFQLQRAHAQVAYYTWLLIGLYFMMMLIHQRKIKKEKNEFIFKQLSFTFLACVLGIGISLLVYLPAIEYTPFSVRGGSSAGGSDYSYATGWSFHPVEMLTFLIPSAFGFGGQIYWGYMPFTDYPNYMGIIVLILAFIAIIYKKGILKWYLLAATLIALFISFGRHFSLVYDLFFNFFPYFNKFRVPHMILILVQFNIAILAAFGLDLILKLKKEAILKSFYPSLIPFVLLFITLIFASSSIERFIQGYFSVPAIRDASQIQMINALRWDLWLKDAWAMLLFVGLFSTLIWLWIGSKINKNTFLAIVVILATLDLMIVNQKIIEPDRSSGRGSQLISKRFFREYYRPDEIVNYLSNDSEKFRIYPAGQLFGDSRFAAFGLESIGGYHPAKLKIYNDFLINTQNAGVFPVLKMLNAKYLILPDAQQISHPSLTLVKRGPMRTSRGNLPTAIYQLNDFLPRAWFVKDIERVDQSEIWQRITNPEFNPKEKALIFESDNFSINKIGKIKSINHSIHEIVIETESDEKQFLVLSEVYYPKRWKAYRDNLPIKTFQVNGLIRGVVIPKGSHKVKFIYDKSSFETGLLISLISLFLSLGLIGFGFYRKKII